MKANEIRQSFLGFFEARGHRIVPSAPVIPHSDPTLLFTNAGMNQFKDVFLGTGKRDYVRAADTQKCIRVSGKHNDLEEVGRDTYHHTFFEMLGNWSFSDYYKKEAIEWAWELLTKEWGLDKRRLYATVFENDDEAEQLWKKITDIDPGHVLKFGKKDNFWEMGETGPCGPCSEIHIDLTLDFSGRELVNKGDARVMEIWNLVFIQNNRNENGELEPLPAKHVDTGMGFERMCAILQGKGSNYDTDVFMPIIQDISDIVGRKYTGTDGSSFLSPWDEFDVAMRVIADHVRMLTFSIADGGLPSNEGRGYVMRKILRRASLFGRTLHMKDPFIYQVVQSVVATMGNHYPEIKEKRAYVERVIKAEEEAFLKTQAEGIDRFFGDLIGEKIRQSYIEQKKIEKYWWVDTNLAPLSLVLRGSMSGPEIEIELRRDIQEKSGINLNISGEDAFKLHDTYGIPLDLTKMWAEDLGLSVDVDRFNQLMEVQKTRSRHAPITGTLNVTLDDVTLSAQATVGRQVFRSKETAKGFRVLPSLSRFVGYDRLETETVIVATKDNLAVLAETPFYGESGGQVGDVGVLRIGDEEFSVTDTQKGPTSNILILDKQAEPYNGTRVHAKVRKPIRHNIERNHSATHIVHEALRRVLGAHVHQQGSLVAPDHLRFDFPHFGKITPEEIRAIEDTVNEKIADDISVFTEVDLPIEKARKIPNVKMFFGDKYGDTVRVVFIDENFSVEFCGGTHVKSTKDIGLFKIISESSIASGVRRIEAVTGEGVQAYINKQLEKVKHIDDQLAHLIDEKEMLERELNKYTAKSAVSSRPTLGAISLTSSQSESIKVLEKTLQEREQTIEHVSKQTQDLKKELSKYKVKEAASGIDSLIAQATALNGFKVVSSKVEASNMDELKSIGDTLRAKLGSGVGVLASVIDEKVSFVCVVTDDLIKSKNLQAGKIVGEMAKQVGGGGGGKAHLATAGGKDVSRLDDALRRTPDIVQAMIANK